MSVAITQQNTTARVADNTSDYGSDLDDETALDILSQAESQPLNNVVLESIEEPILKDESGERRANLRLSRRRRQSVVESARRNSSNKADAIVRGSRQLCETLVEVEYDESNRNAFSPSNAVERAESQAVSAEPEKHDTRSPLERWRKPPKKPLSVTDLISPAWCEQQYEYSLTRYGRIRKTPAMKQGSSVHKVLEEQVHIEVPVEVVSKEDRFGLRIWNTIQGLRTLRETGLTRELEIFGFVEGEVVIGIVDEIGTACPDEGMEERILESGSKGKQKALPPDQRTLTDFLKGSQGGYTLENNLAFVGTLREDRPPTYYVVDVKTRQSRTLPPLGSQSRPTHMQLMLYHRILTALASDQVPGHKIFERYKLDPYGTFSDKFIAQIANLDISAHASTNTADNDETSPYTTAQKEDPLTELLSHNTLASLWTLLSTEFSRTLPTTSLSPLLTAEFRTARRSKDDTEEAGALIGRRSFAFDEAKIDAYVKDEMRWWKGERATRGVEIEEAYKCRICEFAEGCVWRATKVEDGVRKARLRGEGRRRSEV